MTSRFAENVLKELNKFRANPKSIQHQCELIRKGFSRIKAGDPFLNDIDYFVKSLETMKQLPTVEYNEVLSNAAKKELPNFRGKTSYKKYRRSDEIKGIIPDFYMVAKPAMVADDGADEPINVLTKILLDKQDRLKEGRDILCDPKFTQVGIAHEVFDEENMVILIFASKCVEIEPIHSTKKDFLFNIQYHETKAIKKPRLQAFVHHRIRGDIFGGGENFEKTKFQKAIYSHGPNRPKLEKSKLNENQETLRGNKSVKVMTKYSSRTTDPNKAKIKAPTATTTTVKNEKIQETSMKRRNEGTSSKTETRTEAKTTITGFRGKPNEAFSSTTSKITSRTGKKSDAVSNPNNEIPKKSEPIYKTKTENIFKRAIGGNNIEEKKEMISITKIEEKGIKEDDFPKEKSTRRFRRGNYGNKIENKIITTTKVEENNKVKNKEENQTNVKSKDNDLSNKMETKIVSITVTKVEEKEIIDKDKDETNTIIKTKKRFSKEEKENELVPKEETKAETKVEVKEENNSMIGGSSIRRKYVKKKILNL